MYTAKGRLESGDMLRQYSPLVRRLAHQMIAKLPANVEIDDLIQVGMIGLSDALSRFDANQGGQFETFAAPQLGFYLALAGVACALAASLLRRKVCEHCERADGCRPPACRYRPRAIRMPAPVPDLQPYRYDSKATAVEHT